MKGKIDKKEKPKNNMGLSGSDVARTNRLIRMQLNKTRFLALSGLNFWWVSFTLEKKKTVSFRNGLKGN